MEKAYEILRKYAKILSQQEYSAGKGACLVIDTETGLWATREGADFSDLKMGDVHASPYKFIPDKKKAMVISRTPYCTLIQAYKDSLKPSLDDMAQIIGPACVRVKKMPKKMAGCAGAFVAPKNEKPFTVTTGRSLYEAVTALTVLEKSAEIRVKAEQIGGAKYINPAESALMRTVYLKKYSRKEEEVKVDEQAGIEAVTAEIPEIGERELELRKTLVEYGIKLLRAGLVQGTWGNLSIRLDNEYMLVTPSGLDYERLTPYDMVKVNIHTLEYDGDIKPTSEKGLHAEIYKRRADAGSVIHTHSKYACVFAAAEKDLSEEVKLAGYGLPGTKKLMKNTADALGDNFGAIMSHHGMIVCGSDIEDAFSNCSRLEEMAEKSL